MNRMTTSTPLLLAMLICTMGLKPSNAIASHPVVELTKSCPELRYVGRNASFEITVANSGDGPALDVVVTDAIPEGIEFLSADNGGARERSTIVWRLGTLKGGESRKLTAKFRCNQIGKFSNSATVAYCAKATDVCELEVQGIPAILLEVIDIEDPIEVGENVTYEITVTNQGSAVGTNIAIKSTLPQELEYVRTEGPTKGTAQGNVMTFAPLRSLAPRQKATYRVIAKGVAVGDIRFKVTMTSDQMNPPPVQETESTHIYE